MCGVKPTPKVVNKPSPPFIVHGLDKPGGFTTVSKFDQLRPGIKQEPAIYGARFSIELTIRDSKQHFGLGDSQCTTTLAILRFVHLACVAFCVWRLAPLDHL